MVQKTAVDALKASAGKTDEVDFESLVDTTNEALVEATVGFENIIFGGETLEFSKEAVIELYKKCPWLREAAATFVADRTNFMGKL